MEKENFKKYVRENIKNVLVSHDSRYEGCEIVEETNRKNNGKRYPVLVIKQQDEQCNPVINVEEYFRDYEFNGEPLNILLEEMAMSVINKNAPENISASEIKDFDKIKDSIVINVVNYNQNREDLSLYDQYGEFAVIYRIVKASSSNMMYITISQDMLEMWGKTKKEIHDLAICNTERMFPAKEKPLGTLIIEKETEKIDMLEIPEQVKERLKEEIRKEIENSGTNMIMLSNEEISHGASVLFYPGLMERLAEKYGGFYLIPSSVHELMLYPDDGTVGKEELKEILMEANRGTVPMEDWLSDNLYYYDQGLKLVV